jgi:serine phosphatase RsbU (regulator of sigma subunit)
MSRVAQQQGDTPDFGQKSSERRVPLTLEPDSPVARPLSVTTRQTGSRAWLVLLASLAFETTFLVVLGAVRDTKDILGLPGSLMALTLVITGAIGGVAVGLAAALVGGAVYFATVASMGSRGTLTATVIATAIWASTALISALLADALREQSRRRREAAVGLAAAQAAEQSYTEIGRLHASLEKSLLPRLPVAHPTLSVLTAYRPSEARLQLGGDFFDVLPLPDGSLALIIGDVAGHGPDAAALGALLRAGWQALTLSDASPYTTLQSLDRMVSEGGFSEEMFVTACLARIDQASGRASLLCAGHPPPLLVSEGQVSRVAVPPLTPLGMLDEKSVEPMTVELPPSWLLFFYTDGLIEGRAKPGSSERFGEQRLVLDLQRWPAYTEDEQGLEMLLTEIEAANGGPMADDVAVIAVKPMPQTAWQAPTLAPLTDSR